MPIDPEALLDALDPEQRAVATALEGPVSLLSCLTDESVCPRVHTCAARTVWMDANRAIKSAFASLTLAKLVDIQLHAPEPEQAGG